MKTPAPRSAQPSVAAAVGPASSPRAGGARTSGGVPRLIALLLGLGLACWPCIASPHGRSVSYSSWQMTEAGAHVSVRVPLLELSRLQIPLPGLGGPADSRAGAEAVGRYLADHLRLAAPEGPCAATSGPPLQGRADEGWVAYRWSLDCPSASGRSIESRILLDVAPSHLHFARVSWAASQGGQRPRILERVLTLSEPLWSVASGSSSEPQTQSQASVGSSLLDYLVLGVEHILSGWDHLAFVLALILLATRLGEVARLITGFTLAHSLTLALAVTGWVRPEPAPVEAIIGYSVALIAAENGWLMGGRPRWLPITMAGGLVLVALLAAQGHGAMSAASALGLALFSLCHFGLLRRSTDPNTHRIALAFAFGLVHGFGFAGVLAAMELPTARLAPALFGFNVGVELGQLAVVAAIWPLLVLLRRLAAGRLHAAFAELGSAAICGTGVFWFLTRALGKG